MAMYDYLINAPLPKGLFDMNQINPYPFSSYAYFLPFVFGDDIVIFFAQSYGWPVSCIGYVSVDKNGNWIYVRSNVFPTTGFAYSNIIPVPNGFLLPTYTGQTLIISPIKGYKPNNVNPITVNFDSVNITACGNVLTNAVPVSGGAFFYEAVPNSQNGGFIFTRFVNQNGTPLSGGLQGTYEGPSQTFITNQISNVQYLSNGSASAVTYNHQAGLYQLSNVFSSYQQGFSSCGPLPPDFPFPGNFSGANVTFSSINTLLTQNDYDEFSGYVDSNIPGLVGTVNPNFNNQAQIAVFLVFNDGTSYIVVCPHIGYMEFAVIVNNFLYLVDAGGGLYYLTSLSISPSSNFSNAAYYSLQNLRHSASLPFYQSKKVKP